MAVAVAPEERRPIRLVVHDELQRNRLTVLFRLLLALPHLVWVLLWGIAVSFVSFVNWLAVVINREVPTSLHDFTAGYVRYTTHVGAFVFLAAGPFPGFRGRPGYPVDVEIDPPALQNRWSGLFRLVLAFPALLLASLLSSGLTFNAGLILFTYGLALFFSVAGLAAFLAWFYSLVLGRAPRGLRDLTAYALGYGAQAAGYYLLLTGRYPTSDPAQAERYSRLPDHPVRLVVDDELQRSRLTVLFRLLLLAPHVVWIYLWTFAVYVAVILAWVAALVVGRVPSPLHRFIAAWTRYSSHVYAFASLVGQKFPGFTGRAGSYGVDLEIAPPESQPRLVTLFRLVLGIPAFFVAGVLGYVLMLVAFFAWFYALVTGRMPEGLRNLGASCIRYNAQAYAYAFLVTDRYPYSAPVLRDRPERPMPLPMLLLPPPARLPAPPPWLVGSGSPYARREVEPAPRRTDYTAVAIVVALVLAASVVGVLAIRAVAPEEEGVLRIVAPSGKCWSVSSGRNERELLAGTHAGCGEAEIPFDPSGFEAQISTQPPTEEYVLGATVLVDGEVVRSVAPAIRGGLRVRHGDGMPEKRLVIRIEAPPEGCWAAIVDSEGEQGCGSRRIDVGEASTIAFNVERGSPGDWPLFVAVEADGQVVQTFGPGHGEYPRIMGGYSVPQPVE